MARATATRTTSRTRIPPVSNTCPMRWPVRSSTGRPRAAWRGRSRRNWRSCARRTAAASFGEAGVAARRRTSGVALDRSRYRGRRARLAEAVPRQLLAHAAGIGEPGQAAGGVEEHHRQAVIEGGGAHHQAAPGLVGEAGLLQLDGPVAAAAAADHAVG